MSALLLVVFCMAAGALVARLRHPEGLSGALNWWVLYIALPALVLDQVVRLQWSPGLLIPAAMMWGVFLGAWALIAAVGHWRGWSRGQVGALVLVCGLGNTSFVGYPMIEALRGETGLGIAVIIDQLGTFLVLSSLGVLVASIYSGKRVRMLQLARRTLLFPAFLALIAAFAIRALGGFPEPIEAVISRVGLTLIPLALFSVGMQLRLRAPGHEVEPIVWALSWKLMGAPLLIWMVLALLGYGGEGADIAVLQAGMAPMITAGILAQQHGLAPALANRVVGFGIIISLFSVPLINLLL
jgi:predicted permease